MLYKRLDPVPVIAASSMVTLLSPAAGESPTACGAMSSLTKENET
jgi:hypothetical protein